MSVEVDASRSVDGGVSVSTETHLRTFLTSTDLSKDEERGRGRAAELETLRMSEMVPPVEATVGFGFGASV